MSPLPHPRDQVWVLVDRGGAEFVFADKADWLSEWRHRVRSIEEADRPAALRRDGLERLLNANAGVFLSLTQQGLFAAALDATAIIAAADHRLSWVVETCEGPA